MLSTLAANVCLGVRPDAMGNERNGEVVSGRLTTATRKGVMADVAGRFSRARRPQADDVTRRARAGGVRAVRAAGLRGDHGRGHRPRGRDRAAHVLPVLRLQERRALGRIRGAAGADARPPGGLPAADPAGRGDPAGRHHVPRAARPARRSLAAAAAGADPAGAGVTGPLHAALRRLAAGDRGVRGRADRAAARLAAPGHAGLRGAGVSVAACEQWLAGADPDLGG